MSIFMLIVGLLLFVGLVVIHELGHFYAARRDGVEVEEFGLGFPPMAWSRKLKSGLLFSINWLPLGGFVKLKGEHDSAKSKGSFGAASLSAKVRIMLAGVFMNLVTAFILMTLLALVGMPKLIDNQFAVSGDIDTSSNSVYVGMVEDDSPASKGGLMVRDRIISLASDGNVVNIESAQQLPGVTSELAGRAVDVTILRSGEQKTMSVILRDKEMVERSRLSDKPVGYLGISPTEFTLRRSTWSAPVVAAGTLTQFTKETFKGLGNALWSAVRGKGSQASAQVAGPVSIFVLLKDSSTMGFQFTLMIIAIISLTLAIMNALPIPALDGGRLFVTILYHKILRKPLSQETEERIHGTGFLILICLMAVITVVDVKRL